MKKWRATDRVYYIALLVLSLLFGFVTGDATAFVFLSFLGGYLLMPKNIFTFSLKGDTYNDPNQFIELRIGDIISITTAGKNKNKLGLVNNIVRGPGQIGIVHLTPFNCQFELASRRRRELESGDWVLGKTK